MDQAKQIILVPHLDNAALGKAEDFDTGNNGFFAAGGRAHKVAAVGDVMGMNGGYQVTFGQQAVNLGVLDWEGI
jgi:hypothetical protein